MHKLLHRQFRFITSIITHGIVLNHTYISVQDVYEAESDGHGSACYCRLQRAHDVVLSSLPKFQSHVIQCHYRPRHTMSLHPLSR